MKRGITGRDLEKLGFKKKGKLTFDSETMSWGQIYEMRLKPKKKKSRKRKQA